MIFLTWSTSHALSQMINLTCCRLIYLLLGIFPMFLSRIAHLPMSSELPQVCNFDKIWQSWNHKFPRTKPPWWMSKRTTKTLAEKEGGRCLYICIFVCHCVYVWKYVFWNVLFQGGCDLAWCAYTPKLTEFQVPLIRISKSQLWCMW